MTTPTPQPTLLDRIIALETAVAELKATVAALSTAHAKRDQELAAVKNAVGSLTDTNAALMERLAALEAPPDLQPKPAVPSHQQGLPIPPKRRREPGHAPVRTAWGDLGLFDPAVGDIVETVTGTKPDPQRPPSRPGYLDRLKLPDLPQMP